MKKLLATLMALVLALSCTLALAEGTYPAGSQGLTYESEYEIDRDVLKNALTQLGVNEDIIGLADTAAALISEMGEKAVLSGDGFQYELLLKGTSLLSLVGQATDTGFAVGTSLLPNYVLNISSEEIGKLFEGMSSQMEGLQEMDMNAMAEAVSGYAQEFADACTQAITTGEPETGDFVLDGISYNVKVPINVDLVAIVNALNTFTNQLSNDESVQSMLQSLQEKGVNVDLDPSGEGAPAEVDPATLPTMEMDAYMYIDEQGNQGDTTDVVFSVTPAGSEEAATIGDVLVQGKNIRVTAQFLTAGTNVYFSSQPDDATPVNWRLDVEYSGIYAGLAIVAGDVDGASATDIYLFLMDEENPVLCVTASVRQGGELTLSADGEGKTAITMADLTGDNAENMAAVVGMDLLGGLGNLISTASQLMPEETQTITNLAMGAFGGSDEPAA